MKEVQRNQLKAVKQSQHAHKRDDGRFEERKQSKDTTSNEAIETDRLREWLEIEVNLPQYVHLLKENGFEDIETMKDITMHHLQEIGVRKVGHRVKLLKAVTTVKAADTLLQNKFPYILAVIAIFSFWLGVSIP